MTLKKCNVCNNRVNVGIFRFPKDSGTKNMWLEALKLSSSDITENSHVCYNHFRPQDILELAGKKRLRADAFPSLYFKASDSSSEEPLEEIWKTPAKIEPESDDNDPVQRTEDFLKSLPVPSPPDRELDNSASTGENTNPPTSTANASIPTQEIVPEPTNKLVPSTSKKRKKRVKGFVGHIKEIDRDHFRNVKKYITQQRKKIKSQKSDFATKR